MGFEWTKEQREAIDTRDKDILVSAGAGSGKTTVLVERIRTLVCDEHVPVRNLLIVTFTEAAAAEMKERIRISLTDELEKITAAGGDTSYVRRQLSDLPGADISTFHAFALKVIKRFFYLTDLEPGFSVCDAPRAELLKQDAMDDMIEKEFAAANPDFADFLDKYSGDRNFGSVREILFGAYTKLMAMPYPWEWLKEAIEDSSLTGNDFAKGRLWNSMLREVSKGLESVLPLEELRAETFDEAGLDRFAAGVREGRLAAMHSAIEICGESLSNIENGAPDDPQTVINRILATLSGYPVIRARKDEKQAYSCVKDKVKALNDRVTKKISKLKSEYLPYDLETALKEIEAVRPSLETTERLLKAFDAEYRAAKDSEHVVDFSDIEHYCLDILDHEEAAAFYRSRFESIFVDEYQDTNVVQEEIISKITRGRNLFMVGDVKQSIYRFRLADPSIFRGKYVEYSKGGSDACCVIDLNSNHRSKRPVIDFVNETFRGLMPDYDEKAELHCGVDYDGQLLETPVIDILSKEALTQAGEDAADDDLEAVEADIADDAGGEAGGSGEYAEDIDDEISDLKAAEEEAYYTASLIERYVGREYYDTKEECVKKLAKSDIVVLTRTAKNYAETFYDIFRKCGIESRIDDNEGFFDTIEVGVFMDLLTIIDNSRKDIPLISVLHSEIFGFTAEELATVRVAYPNRRKYSYSEAFFKFARRTDLTGRRAEVAEKCRRAKDKLSEWRNMSRVMPLGRFVWKLEIDSGYYIAAGAMPDGTKRQNNLASLVDRAEQFSEDRQVSLYSFIRYINQLKKRKVGIPEASLAEENENAVRIMTIHKSKGLEFPMVIVVGLGSRLRYTTQGKISIHSDVGIGMRYSDPVMHWHKTTLPQMLISAKVREEEEDEQIRILYVAMTRAREFLRLVGTVPTREAAQKMIDSPVADSNSYLSMLCPIMPVNIVPDEDVLEALRHYGAGEDAASGRTNVEVKAGLFGSDDSIFTGTLDEGRKKKIREMLEYEYPYSDSRSLKSKYSVSELNKASAERAAERTEAEHKEQHGSAAHTQNAAAPKRKAGGGKLAVPAFAEKDHILTGAERGTVYHTIMEMCDFAEAEEKGLPYIREVAAGLVRGGMFGEKELDAVDLTQIEKFFATDIGRRCGEASRQGRLEKEKSFTLSMDMGDDRVLVQGVIDCWFRDGGGTVLIDYKSNRLRGSSDDEIEQAMRDTYGTQISIYRRALEEAGFGPVKEAYIYMFENGRLVKM